MNNSNLCNSTSVSWSGDAGSASQIDLALADLSANLAGLHDMIGSVERRFDTVMLPSPPIVETKAGLAPAPLESQVLSRINAASQRVTEAGARLSALINRSQV